MTAATWRLLIHATGPSLITYTLSEHTWEGPVRKGHGITLMSTCRPDELAQVLDQVADLVVHAHPLQEPLT
jgi:hypothetical protein